MNMDIAFFVAVAAAILGQLSDCYTTEVSLASGKLVEGNKIAKWIVSKIGNTGITILKCVGLAQAFPILTYVLSHNEKYGFLAALVAAGIGWMAGILNYIQMRKAGIPLGL